MYEARHQPLLARERFLRRVAAHFGLAAALLAISLAGGMLGYHALELSLIHI